MIFSHQNKYNVPVKSCHEKLRFPYLSDFCCQQSVYIFVISREKPRYIHRLSECNGQTTRVVHKLLSENADFVQAVVERGRGEYRRVETLPSPRNLGG